MPGISALITAIRKRPEHERRMLAVAIYLAGCAIILLLGVSSIEQTLSRGGNRNASSVFTGLTSAHAPARTSASATEPVGPLQALQEAFSTAVSESKNLIAASAEPRAASDLPEGETPPPASLPGAPSAALKTSLPALPEEKKSALRIPVTEPTGPAKTITKALELPLYSSYAAARLLATPLAAKVRHPDSEPAKKTSYIGEVVTYNLGELRRTVEDVYHYFAQ